MPTIRPRGGTFQVDARAEGHGRRSFKTEAEALTALAAGNGWPAAHGSPSKGSAGSTPGITLGDALDQTYRLYWARTRAKSSFSINIGQVLAFFGKDTPLYPSS